MTINNATRRVVGALGALALAGVMGVTGCNDFLQGGELSNDPVRSTVATNRQLFVGVQTNIWSQQTSDPARIVGLWVQQWQGMQSQYYSAYTYSVNEQTTNGFHSAVYAGGGLKDVRKLQENARAQGDTLFLGIAQVQEAMLVGQAADMFGDIVYSQALNGTRNPALDKQMDVYDAVQKLLDDAIANLSSFKGTATNLGPGSSDLNYFVNSEDALIDNLKLQAGKWIRLAHTLKARNYLHTAEVRPAAYGQALTQASQGITNKADDWKAVWSGNANESNFWYQFTLEQRFGYTIPNTVFINFLKSRNDPRLAQYIDQTGNVCDEKDICLSATRIDPAFPQPIVTAQENLLIWAEAAYRAPDQVTALQKLQAAQAIAGVSPTTAAGSALLQAILDEKYIALFQNLEVWNDYKRTCYPNLAPTVAGQKIPARFLYDAGERQTNTSIPGAQSQPTRNQNDPVTAQDPFGNACQGQ